MPIPTWPRLPRRRTVFRAASWSLLAGFLLVSGEALVRARLDGGSGQAVRFYARPIVFQEGTAFPADRLQEALRRLGYARTRRDAVRIGEYRADPDDWVIGRRGFRLGEFDDAGGVTTISLDERGRVERIEDERGERLDRVMLEPEPLYAGPEAGGDHEPVPLAELPDHLVQAVLAVEDRRFYQHWGVDLRRVAGAAVANVRARRVVQGGSTLTQQLAKNRFLSARRTPTRKIREAAMALVLEARHTKEEILEAYLNGIYLGQNGGAAIRGVGSAARAYFGKDVSRLEPRESALLAGLIRGPNLYSPYRHPERARERRNLVLGLMRDQGDLSEASYQRARRASLGLSRRQPPPRVGRYFTDHVRATQPRRALRGRGVSVFTTADMTLQLAAEQAVRDGLTRLERERSSLRRPDGPLQAALVALDPATGEILALVGGRDYGGSQFNRATQARRQPGSAFKPVVALAALADRSHTLVSILEDAPLSVETPLGPWQPVNYDREYRGAVTLREALERSLNVPFARLGLDIGPERIVETARRLGIESPLRPLPSLALGAAELTPLELARAFGVLAAQGYLAVSQATLAVVAADGSVRLRADPRGEQVFDPAETYLVTSALEGAVERGTGRGLRSAGYWGPVAAKSGTTNDHRDAWFVGYTPSLVVAVWVGFDDGRSVGVPGARAALPIFAQFLTAATGDGTWDMGKAAGFAPPSGVEVVEVDRESGLRAGWGCGGEPEYFLEGTAPEREADGCGSFWTVRRWVSTEGSRLYRELAPRIERDLRSSARELRRLAERWSR